MDALTLFMRFQFYLRQQKQEIASVYKEIIILKNDYFLTAGRISDD